MNSIIIGVTCFGAGVIITTLMFMFVKADANDMNQVIFYSCLMCLSLIGIVFSLSILHHLQKEEHEEKKLPDRSKAQSR